MSGSILRMLGSVLARHAAARGRAAIARLAMAVILTAPLGTTARADTATTFTYVVNSAIDSVRDTCELGLCTIREAIEAANADGGLSSIIFDIGALPGDVPVTIRPLSPLPSITGPMTIDGTSQPGYAGKPVVRLDGSLAGVSDGLRIVGSETTIEGLAINRFTGDGIKIEGGSGNRIIGNLLGTDAHAASAGGVTASLGNGASGIRIVDSSNNIVGGTTGEDRNLISGNDLHGVTVLGESASGNVIRGNYIGPDPSGTKDVGNVWAGVSIASSGNVVGGIEPGAGNLLSGNGTGIEISGAAASGNTVQGNIVGTDVTGSTSLPNINQGIRISSASDNTIGGSEPGAGNLVSGNHHDGISVYGDTSSRNVIQGNIVGTDRTGTLAIANTNYGISVYGQSNLLGGTSSGAGNLVSGNQASGIVLQPSASQNVIEGNLIGTNATGTAAIPNGHVGITIRGKANRVGGAVPAARNVISGNNSGGVLMKEGGASNLVQGNYIGVDVSGSGDIGNGDGDGVRLLIVGGNTIGGSAPGAGNVISGHAMNGIQISGNSERNVVQGNLIGTDATGRHAIPNDRRGIDIRLGAVKNLIGGTAPGAGNLVANSGTDGVAMTHGADANVLQGNHIVASGQKLLPGDKGHGILISDWDNVIGGSDPRAGNVIVENAGDGIALIDNAWRNLLSGNVFSGNAGLGIDVADDAVTANDAVGPEDDAWQNFPEIHGVTSDPQSFTVRGVLDGSSGSEIMLEVFAVAECDPSGHGEADRYLGRTMVKIGEHGSATFAFTVASEEPLPGPVVATATGEHGTSELSACVESDA